jgi:hypothetical protein
LQELKAANPGPAQSTDALVPSGKDAPVPSGNEIWKAPSILGFLFGGVQYNSNKNNSLRSKSGTRSVAKIRIFTPQWIYRKVYEAQIIQDRWSCRFNLRPYSIVSEYCELFCCVREGNVEGIQRLFNLGLATPFDRDVDGMTALHVSVYTRYRVQN